MFCPECGTEVAESAGFCRKCGAPLRDDAVRPVAPAQTAAPAPMAAASAVRVVSAGVGQPVVGVIAIIGAALAAIGTMLPWIENSGYSRRGLSFGYLTGSSFEKGHDGVIVLILALAAAALAVHYFRMNSSLASLGTLILGAGAAGVAAYNLVRLISDIRDNCGGCNPMDYLGMGLYMSIVGGVIVVAAAVFGFKQGMAVVRR